MAGSDSLNGKAISDTYKDLLQVPNANAGVDGTLRTVMDGEGTESTLQVSTAGVKSTGTLESTGNLTVGGTLTLGGTAISSLEDGATADQTGAQIKTAYEGEADTNAFTDADHTKLDGIEASATANDTDANLKARANHTGTQAASTISDFDTEVAGNSAVTANTAKVTNATHTGDVTGDTALTIADDAVVTAKIANDAVTAAKLNAALNDLSNVNASPSDGQVLKWVNASSEWQAADDTGGGSGGGISNVSEDTTPQLGGDLDVNSNSIVSASNGDIAVTPDGTGKVVLDGLNWPTADGSAGQILKTDGSGQLSFTAAGESGTVTSVGGAGTVSGLTLSGTVTSSGDLTLGGTLSADLTSDVTGNLPDGNIASASTWNAKQDALTFGIANTNAVQINSADVADDEYARFTASGLESRSTSEVLSDIGAAASAHNHNSAYLQISNNLSDVTASTARTNLGLGAAAEKAFDTAGGVQAYDADTVKADTATNFTAPVQGGVDSTQASTGVCDLSEANNHAVTISGATTISVTNPTAGQSGVITITHDGSTAISFSGLKFEGGSAPSPSTSGVDLLAYYVESASRVSAVLIKATA
tara:strand:- start:2848 stop:4620 length:1773 start_codon:yes stop_codon:yes gene_type:complete